MTTTLVDIEALTEKIIGCAIEVHRILGPGLLESVYRECMIIELRREHLRVDCERQIPFEYKGQRIRGALKLGLLVEDCIVVELKAVERLHPVHSAQVITYLKLTGYPAGLLMNFNATTLRAGLRRLEALLTSSHVVQMPTRALDASQAKKRSIHRRPRDQELFFGR
jgi:GxxExxY protein